VDHFLVSALDQFLVTVYNGRMTNDKVKEIIDRLLQLIT
jgi:hypothetical protein